MTKSIYLSICSNLLICWWVVTSWTQPSADGRAIFTASLNTENNAALDFMASLPPFNINPFPVLIAKVKIWTAASGRASNIIHITPLLKR